MNHESKLLGYYNYTVVLTYIGMLFGFTGLIYVMDGNSYRAVLCLMAAGFCDMFDGAVASTKKDRTCQEKCFGIQIDSLSDLICFGVLPAVLTYSLNRGSYLALGISSLYALCALIRLAYFNVDEQERQGREGGSRTLYYGMPVTMSALFVPVLYGIGTLSRIPTNTALTCALGVIAVLFLLPIPLKKPKVFGKLCVICCGIAEIILILIACGDV